MCNNCHVLFVSVFIGIRGQAVNSANGFGCVRFASNWKGIWGGNCKSMCTCVCLWVWMGARALVSVCRPTCACLCARMCACARLCVHVYVWCACIFANVMCVYVRTSISTRQRQLHDLVLQSSESITRVIHPYPTDGPPFDSVSSILSDRSRRSSSSGVVAEVRCFAITTQSLIYNDTLVTRHSNLRNKYLIWNYNIIIIGQPQSAAFRRMHHNVASNVACLALTFAKVCPSSICSGRFSTA